MHFSLIQARKLAAVTLSVIGLGIGVGAVAVAPAHAGAVPPPSNVLQHPRNQVAAGVFVEQIEDGRYRFARIEDVRGADRSPQDLLVRAPDWLAAELSRGERYLFAYSSYIGNPRFPRDYIVDSDGPLMVITAGLEPALFLDTPGLRARILHPLDKDTLNSPHYLAEVIDGLRSDDTQLQNFYSLEVTQLNLLSERKDPELIDAIKHLLANADGHPSARASLLRLAAARAHVYGKNFVEQQVTEIVKRAPLTGYQAPAPQAGDLVRAALEIAEQKSVGLPISSLARLVRCDNAALAEAALLAIRRAAPTQERAIAGAALKTSLLTRTTREFLTDHLRRLDLAAASASTTSATDSQQASTRGEVH